MKALDEKWTHFYSALRGEVTVMTIEGKTLFGLDAEQVEESGMHDMDETQQREYIRDNYGDVLTDMLAEG